MIYQLTNLFKKEVYILQLNVKQIEVDPVKQVNLSPQPRLRTYKRQEHWFVAITLIYTLGLALWTINSAIKVNTAQHELQAVQAQISAYQLKNQNLQQEIDQNLSFDHLNQVAHQDHLKLHPNNIKTIK